MVYVGCRLSINSGVFQPLGGGMFGRDVARTVKQEARQLGGGSVPLIVQTTISFLRRKGKHMLREHDLSSLMHVFPRTQ